MTLGIEFRICGQILPDLWEVLLLCLSLCPWLSHVALPRGEYLCVHTCDLSDGFNAFHHSSPAHI